MKKFIHSISLFLSLTAIVSAVEPSESAPRMFPQSDLMRIGAYYYPEAWPSNQWARDFANMKRLNMEFIHMAEFAWTFMEPEEGRFELDWLEQCVKLAKDNGLKVILCTPPPAPPVWLAKDHPEILMIDAAGRQMRHGSRQQGCWSVPTFRKYVGRIVDKLGERFGGDPRVWGWQLGNELSHYGKEPCFCDSCQSKFREWLKNKYGTIDKLNRDWGTAFWSQRYQNFEQIRIPNREELVAQINEHALLDSQRWFAEEAAGYLRFQANILRQHCGDHQWITHNFMHAFDRVYPVLNGDDFEIMTWTIYPAHGNLNEGPLGFRLGGAAPMSFAHDFFRSINGYQGIMELQPGQVNWGEVNPQTYPGAVRMWLLRAFAGGSKLVCTYRFRQPLFGAEQFHHGLVGTDGVTPTIGGEQYSRAARDMSLLRQHYNPTAKEPGDYAARRTALLYNFENRWDIDNHKQNVRWDTMGHIFKHYRALKSLGCPVDVITEDKEFNQYPFLVAPAYQLVDSNLVQRWRQYAESGGHLVLTCRTGIKDRRGHLWEAPWAGPILDLIGAKVSFYDTLPAPFSGKVEAGNETYNWFTWGEILKPNDGTRTLASYADQFYAEGVAAVTRKLGKGTVTYVGVDSDDGGLEHDLLRGVFERAGVPVRDFADGFIVDWRDGFWVATNFTGKEQRAPVPADVSLLIGERDVPTAGVAVWQE